MWDTFDYSWANTEHGQVLFFILLTSSRCICEKCFLINWSFILTFHLMVQEILSNYYYLLSTWPHFMIDVISITAKRKIYNEKSKLHPNWNPFGLGSRIDDPLGFYFVVCCVHFSVQFSLFTEICECNGQDSGTNKRKLLQCIT